MVRIPYFEALTDDEFAWLSPGEMRDAYAALREHHVFETQELWRRLGEARKRAGDRVSIEDLREIAALRGGDSLGLTENEQSTAAQLQVLKVLEPDREAMQRAFDASPERLAESAVRAAQPRPAVEDDDLLGKPGRVSED